MSVRVSVIHKSEVTLELPHSSEVRGGGIREGVEVAMPLSEAISLYYELKDMLREEGYRIK